MSIDINNAIAPQITTTGLQIISNALAQNNPVQLTHIAFGDGSYTPTEGHTALASQTLILPVDSSQVLDDHQIHVSVTVDDDAEYWIREVGFMITYEFNGESHQALLALHSDPDVEKAIAYKACGSTLLLAFDLKLSSLPPNSVTIDGSAPLSLNGATQTQLGMVALATDEEVTAATADNKVITPKNLAAVKRHTLNSEDGNIPDAVFVDDRGYVGVGSNHPSEKLTVSNGNLLVDQAIKAKSADITQSLSVQALYVGDQWQRRQSLPGERDSVAVAAFEGDLYAFGGSELVNNDGVRIKDVVKYTLETGVWDVVAMLPNGNTGADAIAYNNKIYLTGERLWSGNANSTQIFDPNNLADPFVFGPALNSAYTNGTLTELDGVLYYIGGWDDPQGNVVASSMVERWDIDNGAEWEVMQSLPMTSSLAALHFQPVSAVVSGKIYVFTYDGVFAYTPALDSWEIKHSMPTPVNAAACEVMHERIYVVGGNAGADLNAMVDLVQEYDPKTDTWLQGSPALVKRSGTRSAVIDNKMYIVGGSSLDTASSRLDYLDVYIPRGEVSLKEHVKGILLEDGNVGIGVTEPAYPLDVDGAVHTNSDVHSAGLLVHSEPWTDNHGSDGKGIPAGVRSGSGQIAPSESFTLNLTLAWSGVFLGTIYITASDVADSGTLSLTKYYIYGDGGNLNFIAEDNYRHWQSGPTGSSIAMSTPVLDGTEIRVDNNGSNTLNVSIGFFGLSGV